MKKVVCLALFSSMLLSACTVLQPFSFERLQAADVSFPEQVKHIGIINHMPAFDWDDESVNYTSDVLGGDGKIATEALAQGIASTGYFAQVVICDSALRVGTIEEDRFISGEKADSLMESLDVDLLIAMESVRIQLKESSMFLYDVMMDVPAMDGAVSSLARVYAPGRKAPLYAIVKSDTICWELTPELTYSQMIKDASGHAASLAVSSLIPHWEESQRYYFDKGGTMMRDAGVYVREQNWEEAAGLWQKLYDSRKGKTRMQAAYNLALYYELQNDLDRAIAYLDTAASLVKEGSWNARLVKHYQLQLDKLVKQSQRLNLQMKRFEP